MKLGLRVLALTAALLLPSAHAAWADPAASVSGRTTAAVSPSLARTPSVWGVAPVEPTAPSVPSVPAGAVPASSTAWTSAQAQMRYVLKTGAIVGDKQANAAKGVNASSFVTIQRPDGKGTVVAIVKGSTTGMGAIQRLDGKGAFTAVPSNGQYVREAAVSHLAERMHVGFVPPTTRRVIDGEPSSVQLVVGGGALPQSKVGAYNAVQMNRADAEKLRVFDYVIGNRDRHNNNVLVYLRGSEYHPVAIDNGLSLPEGPMSPDRFSWPTGLTREQSGPLLPQTKAFIASIDIKQVAKSLARSGVSREATLHTLRRIERLKMDPSFLELDPNQQVTSTTATNLTKVAVTGSAADQGLPPETLKRIDAVVAESHGAVH